MSPHDRPDTQRRRLLAAALSMAPGLGLAAGEAAPPAAPDAPRPDDLGVELVGVRLSGADFLIDVRYRVVDVARAQPLLERKVIPVLVNQANGDRYYIPQVPKVGQLRQSATSKQPAQAGKVYFMLFANPDRRLRIGEKVTLHAGDSTFRDLLVQ